jgi:hypothetical protein
MPLYQITAPNGVTYQTDGPDGATPEQVRDVILAAHPEAGQRTPTPEATEDKPGSALGRGFSRSIDITQQGLGSALEGIGRSTGIKGLEQYGAGVAARNTKELEDAEQYATRRQDVEGVGTGLSYAGETLAESAVPMGIGIGAGMGAGALAGSVVPGIGTVAGAAVGAAGAALSQIPLFYGWNRERQKEAVQQGIIPEVSESAAFLTAIPQAALEGIADRLLLGTGKLLVKPGSGLFTGLAKGTGAGIITEVPTEIGQQVLERAQAGLPLDNDEAMQEYTDAAVGAGLIGGGIGGVSGGISGRRGAAKEIEEKAPPPPPPGTTRGTPAGFDINTATEDEARANLAFDPTAVEEFNRYRAMRLSVPNAFEYATRGSLNRTPAPKTTAEKSGGPKQDDLGGTGGTGTSGPKSGVLTPSGGDVDGRTATTVAEATRTRVGDVSTSAQQAGSGEAGKPGALDDDNTIGMREEARIKYDEDAERLENELRSLSALEEENVETDEERQNRVYQEEARRRDMEAKSETGAGPSLFDVDANPEGKEVARPTFAPSGTGGLPLFSEERNVAGATPLRTDEVLQPIASRLIKAGTPEAEEIMRRERPAPGEKVQGQTEEEKAAEVARERMDNVADYFENWVDRNPSFAPIRDAVKPYMRSAARAVVEDNAEPTDALLAAIPQKYKAQRAAVRNLFPRGTADEIIPSVPRVPQTMRRPQEVVLDRKLAEAIRFINAYVKSVNAPEIQKEWEAELEKAGIDFTKPEDTTQGSLLPKDTVANFLSRIKEYERVKGVKPPAPKAKAEEAPEQDKDETDDQYKRRLAGKTDFFEPPESTAPERDKTEEYIKNRRAAILGPKETTEETAAPVEEEKEAPLTDAQRKYGENVAEEHGGTVVYQSGDMGLVRGYGARDGQPVYMPFKGEYYFKGDVDGTPAALLSAEEKTVLTTEKARLEAEDAKKHTETPFVTFDKSGVAVSEGVDKRLAGVISAWKKMLLPGVKLYVTTAEDVAKNKNNFTGNLRAVGSFLLKQNLQGSTRFVGDNTYYIVFKKSTKPTLNFETIAHEMGHVHEIEVLTRLPTKTRKDLEAEHLKWLGQQKGRTARELVNALRGRAMGSRVRIAEAGMPAAQMNAYWKSFEEWYADQTARWAVSNEKPVSAIDKFFASLGRALRKFYNTLRGQGYLPNETFAQYLNSVTSNVDLSSIDAAPRVSTVFEAKSEAGKAEEEISKAQAQYQQGESAAEQVSGIGLAIEARDPEAFNDALDDISHRAGQNLTKVLSKTLPTSSMTFIMGRMDKQAGINGQEVIAEADAASDTKANLSSGLFDLVKPVVKFITKHGYGVLANMQSTARLYKYDPLSHQDAQAGINSDHYIKGYDKLIANATTPSEKADYVSGRARRAAEIAETHKVKDELAKLPGGLEAYNILRQFYRDAYNIRRAARDKLFDVMSAGDPAARARFEKIRTDFFEKVRTAPDPNYHNIEKSPVLLEEYSPFMRFGDYYLRVTKGVNGNPEYYHFDDATVRRRFLQRRASELGVSATDADMFQTGKLDTQKGRMEFLNSDAALRAMFDLIDSNSRLSPEQKESLKDDAYQARLDALPESDLRQHFKHAKERTGWAPDPLRVYNAYATKFINDITKLQHEQKFHAVVSKARDLIKSMPLGDTKDKLAEYMEAVIKQGTSAFSPPDTNALVSFMNRAGFLYFLSSGVTAMAQFVSVPGRVYPAIGSVYGYAKAGALFTKYTKVAWGGKSLKTTLPDGTKEWSYPGLDKSKAIKNNSRLLNAFKTLEEMRVYSLTPTAAIVGLEDTPTTALNAVDHKVKSAVLQTGAALFNTTETLSRQISAMMRYEAAYDARIAKGMDSKTADREAIAEAAAETERALGNYRETERPAIMKGPIGRMVFQFKMYSVNTTKFFVENLYLMTRDLDPEVRRQARSELLGVMAIGGIFSGVTGMFGSSAFIGAIGMLLDQFEDDEDKRRRIEEDPVFANDYNGYFRYRWLPAHFGKLGASIIEVGPLSALTPLNLASRTSYNDLWLREGLTGSNWSESVKNLIMANIGPAVSFGGSLDLAAKDFNDGEVMRGVERMMPAIVRGPLMSYRLATEGAETRKGDKIVSPEELSVMQIAGAAMGMSPQIVADYQKKRVAALNFQTKLKSDKSDTLRAINRAMSENDYDAIQRAMQKKADFNAKYPSLYAIDDDTLNKSYEAYEEVRDKTERGVKIEDDELPYYNFLIDGGEL